MGGNVGEHRLHPRDPVHRLTHGQHDAFVDRAVEGQTAVRVSTLDRADMIVPARPHHRRMGGVEGQAQRLPGMARQPQIFLRSRLGIDFGDDPVLWDSARHYHLGRSRAIMLPLEHMDRPRGGQDGDHGGAMVETAAVEDRCFAEIEPVA